MNEVEALQTLLSNSPLAAAILFLGYKAKAAIGKAFERMITAHEASLKQHEATSKAQAENTIAVDANTIAINKATQAKKEN